MKPLALEPLNRALHRPHVGWLSLVAAAAVGAALPRGTPAGLRLLVAAMLAGAVAIARWSWLKLWRRGTNDSERLVYDHGVRTVGPGLYFALVLILGYQQHVWERLLRMTPNAWMQVIMLLVVSVPLALWIGFGWGWLRSRLTTSP